MNVRLQDTTDLKLDYVALNVELPRMLTKRFRKCSSPLSLIAQYSESFVRVSRFLFHATVCMQASCRTEFIAFHVTMAAHDQAYCRECAMANRQACHTFQHDHESLTCRRH